MILLHLFCKKLCCTIKTYFIVYSTILLFGNMLHMIYGIIGEEIQFCLKICMWIHPENIKIMLFLYIYF